MALGAVTINQQVTSSSPALWWHREIFQNLCPAKGQLEQQAGKKHPAHFFLEVGEGHRAIPEMLRDAGDGEAKMWELLGSGGCFRPSWMLLE